MEHKRTIPIDGLVEEMGVTMSRQITGDVKLIRIASDKLNSDDEEAA